MNDKNREEMFKRNQILISKFLTRQAEIYTLLKTGKSNRKELREEMDALSKKLKDLGSLFFFSTKFSV